MVWREAREIIWERRYRLAAGFALMLVGRLAALVLPATSKYLVDDVVGASRGELLVPLATAAGLATLVQAAAGFANSQVLGVTAQHSITEMRKRVHDHVMRLPVGYFDSVKSGELISRIMTDAEGIRNLVGTGLVQLVGGILTATVALSVLFYLNWFLTTMTIIVLSGFAGMMAFAFKRLRPLFRKRGELNATATGRLGEALGGIRNVKAYTAEERESSIFAGNVDALFENVRKAVTAMAGVSAGSTVIFGTVGVLMILVGGRSILSGSMSLGDFVMYIFFTGLVAAPLVQISSIGTQLSEAFAGLDRIREIRSLTTEDDEDREPQSGRAPERRHRLRGRGLRLRGERAGAERHHLRGAGRDDDGPCRLVGIGQEHAREPRAGVQPSPERPGARGRRRSRERPPARLSRAGRAS